MSTTVSQEMVWETCMDCGIVFGIPENLLECRRHDRKSVYCPNGHETHYPYGRTYEELVEEIQSLKQRIGELTHLLDQAQARREDNRPESERARGSPHTEPGPCGRGKTRTCPCCNARKPYRGFRKVYYVGAVTGGPICPECRRELDGGAE